MTMKAELKERMNRLIDTADEQRLARLQMVIHREEGGVNDDGNQMRQERDDDWETMQGYSKEENAQFLEECEQIFQDALSGKEPVYTLEQFKDIMAGKLKID